MLSEGYTFTAPRPFPLLAAAAFHAGFIHLTRRNCFNKTLQNLSYRTLPRRHSVATWRFEHTDDRHSIGENFYDTCAFQSIRERRQSTECGQKQAARIWQIWQMTYHSAYLRYNLCILSERDWG
jgi:hypothetical protein